MESLLSQKKTNNSEEAIQALENSINILARMLIPRFALMKMREEASVVKQE